MAETVLLHVPRQLVAPLLRRTRRWRRRRALRRALGAVYPPFANQHAAWVASWFDDHFLAMHAAPLVLGAWETRRRVTPAQLAAAWRAQFAPTNAAADVLCTEATQVAAAFLELLDAALDAYPAYDNSEHPVRHVSSADAQVLSVRLLTAT